LGAHPPAVGDARSVLVSAALQALTWLAVAFALLPHAGVQAVGIGWMASSLVESAVLVSRTKRHLHVYLGRELAFPTLCAIVTAALGWFVASHLGTHLWSAIAGALVAAGIYSILMLVFRRRLVDDAMQLGLRSLKALGR